MPPNWRNPQVKQSNPISQNITFRFRMQPQHKMLTS
jgi:hypothetical protein